MHMIAYEIPEDHPQYKALAKPGGFYDKLATKVQNMGKAFIGNADYKKDFWKVKTWGDNKIYQDGHGVYYATAIGEIAPETMGTLLGARGNHYSTPEKPRPVTEADKDKWVIALKRPTEATDALDVIWNNQLVTLCDTRAPDEEDEIRDGLTPSVKMWVKSMTDRHPPSIILMQSGPLYKTPGGASPHKTVPLASKKRSLPGDESSSQGSTASSTSGAVASTSQAVDAGPKLAPNAFYNPNLMPMVEGDPNFQLGTAKVVQQPFVDSKGDLIAPWKTYHTLRPGTLVMVKFSMHYFHFDDPLAKNPHGRRAYQLNIENLRILKDSPPVPIWIQDPNPTLTMSAPIHPSAASLAFDNFEIPDDGEETQASAVSSAGKGKGKQEDAHDTDVQMEDEGDTAADETGPKKKKSKLKKD